MHEKTTKTPVDYGSADTMETNTAIIDTTAIDDDFERSNDVAIMSSSLRFWLLLIPCIPSIICSIIVLGILLSRREHRRSLNHRIIIVQLIGGLIFLLTHLPIYLSFLRLGYVWPATPSMCQFWWFVGDGYSDTMTILMAWAAFERHILVFHDQLVSTWKKRFFTHYLPMTLIILHCPLYYLIVMAFPPCENEYEYDEYACGSSCLYKNKILILYDTLVNDIIATLLVAIFSIALVIRVIRYSRTHLRRRIQWNRHRKIIIILLSISVVYLMCNLPMMILQLAHFCGLSDDLMESLESYFEFLNYFIFMIYPFICLTTISDKCLRRKRNTIGPIHLTATRRPKL